MLRRGQTFTLDGKPFKVQYVNACRAHCVGIAKRTVTVTDKHGQTRSFIATVQDRIDISPSTDLDTLKLLEAGRLAPVFPR